MIEARSDIQITDLERRAAQRWFKEEAIHQKNMEDIAAKAIPLLNDDATPGTMEDDWIANFFAKSRVVSDSEVQELWARLLAGEANSPGTFSKRTVNLLSDLDKGDAELFTRLCGLVWTLETEIETLPVPLVLDVEAKIYSRNGIDFMTLHNFESLGLLKFDQFANVRFTSSIESQKPNSPDRCLARYFGRPLLLDLSKVVDNSLRFGQTFFTNAGEELARICGGKPVDGFYDYVKEQWKQYLQDEDTNEQDSIGEGYAILNELVGFVESDSTDGSINHDDLIYELRSKP